MSILKKSTWAIANAVQGYNLRSNRAKFQLIRRTFTSILPRARSIADLGGVWNVDAAYTKYTLRNYPIDRAVLVDTDYPHDLIKDLSKWNCLEIIQGDFTSQSVLLKIGFVDILFLFDILLHQANPHWDDVLKMYSARCACMIIYNQQWNQSSTSVRLTDMPLEKYLTVAPKKSAEAYRDFFARRDQIHPRFHKPYIDIHNMWQWGITDDDMRSTMSQLGFHEVYFANFGPFSNLSSFENHAFIFTRNGQQSLAAKRPR